MMLTIHVAGIPAPQGSKTRFPNGGMAESSKAVGPWREAIRAETARELEHTGGCTYLGPVYVSLLFVMPRPKGHYGTGRNAGQLRPAAPTRPSGKPDIDKLIRAVLDGITQGGAVRDDAQVVDLATSKVYPIGEQRPGVQITVAYASAPLVARLARELEARPGYARFGADDSPETVEAKMATALGPAKVLLEQINNGASGHVAELRLGGRAPGLYAGGERM